MFSSENPSCSSKDSDLVSGHEDHLAQPPNFSIRDYVFKSRSKDIKTNWPFHGPLLQLCLDNGINDLLPPLQPPNLVRAHCLRKEVESEKLLNCVKNKTVSENGDSEVDVVLEFKLKQGYQSDINASSMTSHDLSERISGLQLKKKCKVSSGKEISMLEDLTSNSIVLSDPMASQVCPVCKLFTSSSNTTLNAHIDQCLSSDQSNTMRDVTEFTKPRVKPRKKWLMVDIYTTAPHCTLEDLDGRNGTNWAATLTPVTPAIDIGLETKRTKFAPLSAENDIHLESKRAKVTALGVVSEGKVGDIYVDSNGTKLLILSKLDDSSPLVSKKNFKPKKCVKGLKEGHSCSNITKKNILKPKFSEFMVDNPQRRKLRIRKGFKGENGIATDEEHIGEVIPEKEESTSQLLNAHDQIKNNEASTLGHWVCSKRSDLSKKLDNKGITKGSEKLIVASRNLSFKCPKPNLGNSSLKRSHSLNSSLKSGLSKIHCISLKEMGVDKFITPKKFKKRRSILQSSKWRGEKTSVNGGIDGSSGDSGLISSRDNETSKIHKSNFFEDQENQNMSIRDLMSNSIVTPTLDSGSEEVVESISRGQTEEEDEESNSTDQTEEENEESVSRDQNKEEDEESVSRDQNKEEDETSTYNHEVQCEDAINNELIDEEIQIECDQTEQILQHGELQTDTSSFEEPNPCFPNDGELTVEKIQEYSSKYIRVESCQGHNMIVDMESSGSAVSTTSTISPRSPVDDRINSKADQVAEHQKDNNVLLSSQARKPSCSCCESLSRESQFSNPSRKNLPPYLFIKPPALPSFQIRPNLDLLAESVITTDSSKSAMNISTPRSGAQSASSPILRLMGKDLVVSKEEPKILPCASRYISEQKLISFRHLNNGGFIGYNNHYLYPMQSMGNHKVMPLPPQRSYAINSYPVPTITPNQAQEVIVIDDEPKTGPSVTYLPQTIQNPNLMAPQRLFACFPSQNPNASRGFTSTGQREASEGSFMFPSPSSLYFSPSLR